MHNTFDTTMQAQQHQATRVMGAEAGRLEQPLMHSHAATQQQAARTTDARCCLGASKDF